MLVVVIDAAVKHIEVEDHSHACAMSKFQRFLPARHREREATRDRVSWARLPRLIRADSVVGPRHIVMNEVCVRATDPDEAAADERHDLVEQWVLKVDPRRVCFVLR